MPSKAHTECALLGEGQQTVLPYSVHLSGNLYEFYEGKSFDEIDIAETPQWIIERMTTRIKTSTQETMESETSSKVLNTPLIIMPTNISDNLTEVLTRCKMLNILFGEQITTGLSEEKWFTTISLLVSCDLEELAYEFSKASIKHSKRSDTRIEGLIQDRKNKKNSACIRCSTLGCSEEKTIANCMGYVNKNENGEITNSPRKLISYNIAYNTQIGFRYDKKGNFAGINGNIFARHILENFSIRKRSQDVYYIYKDNFWNKIDMPHINSLLYNFFNTYEKDKWSGTIESCYMSPLIRICEDVSKLIQPIDYICLKNGIFNLNTFKLEEHTEDIFCTTKLDIEYNPNEDCPMFKSFLKDIFKDDPKLVSLAQEIMGYSMCSSTNAQKFFILIGEGSNGKSVFCEILMNLCGMDNVSTIPLTALASEFKLAQIVDKVLNISTENDMTINKANVQVLKALTSGDPIQINEKYEKTYSYVPYAKMIFATNRLPMIVDKSFGYSRRVVIIPFDKTYSANPKPDEGLMDKSLNKKLLFEKNGMFNFAIEGLQRLIKNNFDFTSSDVVDQLIDEYKLDINPYLDFVRTNLELSENTDRIETKKLHKAFADWCDENNHDMLAKVTIRTFMKEIKATLKTEGIANEAKKSSGKQYFHNLKFNDEYMKENYIIPIKPGQLSKKVKKPIELEDIDQIL